MKTLPPGLAASLASGATTLAWCWLLTRADGLRLGFTDHDEDLVVEGVACAAETGLAASALEQSTGLAVDGLEVMGALADGRLAEAELARGLFDGAAVEVWRVDWQRPADRVLVMSGHVGEVARGRAGFVAELRSLSAALNQPRGRLYQRACDALLGDARCGIDLTRPLYRAAGTVAGVLSARTLRTEELAAFAEGWFAGGRLAWTSGANAGLQAEVRGHARPGPLAPALLDLWEPCPEPIAPGDAFTLTAGCDKTFDACRSKFANAANFRGCPHIPGNDYATAYAASGAGNDGGRVV
ncbi:DUF2163 domain-containing protein [Methylobacterium isbiliense]|uniref:Bacteriophage phiJL001 Gp84 C-terminal domain-containing protein n=1 Tax=Methylobacterium isbiliense TaxID=315478 RepID=A0ABQ4SHN2_9HYPH|nr:DUF2163 domain-containing protein [Methylobacterium isbiliense]MDN3623079.1 DUF2163 domain-containing protein [Methylobacterium isbiliense]GJE01284.1 hypothetical protein GMJLKIPL_3214 [Methylobacterium isbiliense]